MVVWFGRKIYIVWFVDGKNNYLIFEVFEINIFIF